MTLTTEMREPELKYLVLNGHLPGEGMWSTAESYSALVAQIKEAYGEDYDPIFKYKLACNPKMISPPNGTCYILVDDEDDFELWKYGYEPVPHHRDPLDDIHYPPKPLTQTLYVYRRQHDHKQKNKEKKKEENSPQEEEELQLSVSPPLLHAADDVVPLPLHMLLPQLTLQRLGVRVLLRHSSAPEALLLSSRNVHNGSGEGHWGLLVRKAQSAWGAQRPAFRYIDFDRGVTAVDIFNVRDYALWNSSVGRERVELIAMEHVYRGDVGPRIENTVDISMPLSTPADKSNSSTIYNKDSSTINKDAITEKCGMCDSGDGRDYTVTVAATVRGVHCGLFGPTFTSDALIPMKGSQVDDAEERSLEHHKRLVMSLTRNGLF
ncbi:uncharacterized protein TM35_000461450 [Trypanosoma theileri]|uniref:Uncharacterized protein n=1 Tax=Trypanosoma theileri TaxID=67003 RepID=A0A1X0NI11_9TRYP|nr:uncharacterized protein TM35_000461450 [Trypanosoma theileri]ORC84326.1 hypothetical protein TM35_000461450 [Trypanosoma theileri]